MGGKSADPNKAAMKAQKEQMKRLDSLEIPDLQEYILQNPQLAGLLDAENIEDSELGNLQVDSTLRDNQLQALESLKERSQEGLTASDKYEMEQMLGGVSAQQKSNQAGIESEMARRGMDSSGAALMSKLQNKQSGANNARDKAMQMAAQAQQNKMGALQALGQQSGQMQQQDYNRKANAATAQDAIARSNAMNKQNVSSQNLAARQGIENQRANTANQQSQVKNQLSQQNFENQMSKATGQGSVANSMSSIAGSAAEKPGAIQSALGGASTGASLGATVGGPAGAGYGAAIGAGAGVLSSMFEDGGIANKENLPIQYQQQANMNEYKANETKQHESFKKKYMKRIQDEVMASSEKPKTPVKPDGKTGHGGNNVAANGGVMQRNFADPATPVNRFAYDPNRGSKIGINNDSIGGDVNSIQDVKDVLENSVSNEEVQKIETHNNIETKPAEESGLDGDKLAKGLGALSKLLGDGKTNRPKLNVGSFQMDKPENIMAPVGPTNYTNPFGQQMAQLEDGGLLASVTDPSELRPENGTDFASPEDRKSAMYAALLAEMSNMNPEQNPPLRRPEMADGGSYYSDGGGDIIDSGEESYAGDRVDAKVNDGEIIINAPQQQRLMDFLRGKISVDELGTDDIVEGVPREYRDELHEELDEEVEGSDKVEGIQALLDMLGK